DRLYPGQSLKSLAAEEMTEKDNTRFVQTVDKGKMTFEFAMYYATDGNGTNDEVLKQYLFKDDGTMYSKAEMAELKAKWLRSPLNEDKTKLEDLIDDETSGREGFDLKEAL